MIRRTVIGLACAAFAVFGIAQAAFAQNASLTAVNGQFSARIGVLVPFNRNSKLLAGDAQLSGGLDYAFEKITNASTFVPTVYLDYQGGSRTGSHLQTYAAGVAIRTHSVKPHSMSPYVGLGIGAYYSNGRLASSARSSSNTSLGGKVFAGLEWSGGYFIEAYADDAENLQGVSPGGWGGQVGVRF